MNTYRIRTWDVEVQEFTPQDGVPEIVRGIAELRSAIRALRGMGYEVHRQDPSVLIEREDFPIAE